MSRSHPTDAAKPASANLSAPRTLEEHLAGIAALNLRGPELRHLAEALLQENFALKETLAGVRQHHEELHKKITAYCAPEHYPAVITSVHRNGGLSVEVYGPGFFLEVPVDPAIPPERLRVGARGLLARTRNCLLHVDGASPRWSDVGSFEAYTDDRTGVLLKHQEQLVKAVLSDDLAELELRKGDLIGFDRDGARLAYARVEPPGREDLFFEKTPADRFEELGGLDREIARLKRAIHFHLSHPELATRYRLPTKRGILLEGPPGNGKTKLARCLAGYIAGLVPAGECRFMAIAGSSDYSMWLGQSEQKIRARFQAARELAGAGGVPVVLFFDEIDAIGRRRGADLGSSAPDRILATLLAELDGMQQVTNVIVIGATNRADILDPGLLRAGRLGDLKIRIPAPNRPAARAILNRYLDGLPLAVDAVPVVEALLSRVYSPRGEYAELIRVTLRDGRKVPVAGGALLSGAALENVIRAAADAAADREAQAAAVGITEADLAAAMDRELRSAVALLTPHNVRSYIPQLPQDVDPVAIEPVGPGAGTARYTRGA
jgi:proteasome-associated ATPase